MKKFNITFTTYRINSKSGENSPETEPVLAESSSMGNKEIPVGTVVFYNKNKEAIAVFHNVKSCVQIGE